MDEHEQVRRQLLDRQEALAAGWRDADIKALLRRPTWQRMRRGVYVDGPVDLSAAALEMRVMQAGAAVHAIGTRAVASHETAAVLHGLPLIGRVGSRVTITVPNGSRSHRDFTGVHVHRAALPAAHLAVAAGSVPVTSVARTLVDLARRRPPVAALVPLDAALHRRLIHPGELADVLNRCRGWPGARQAALMVDFADGLAESPLESYGRWTLHRLGLPAPVLQHEFVSPAGQRMRTDLWYPDFDVVGEADGMDKYTDPSVLRAEKLRQECLEQLGQAVVRFTWQDLDYRAPATAHRFQTLFAIRARRRRAS